MMRKLSGSKNRASWSWGPSWPKPDRLQVSCPPLGFAPTQTRDCASCKIQRNLFLQLLSVLFLRAWGSAEICEAFPDLHQQGKGCPTGALSAGPLPGHGGGDGSGGGTVPGVHRVGQGREENLPATSSGGECGTHQEMLQNKGDSGSDEMPRSSY